MDMCFHWLHCRENQKQFCTYWHAGATDLADYVTKHYPAIHHQSICSIYLTKPTKLLNLRHKVQDILKNHNPTPYPYPTCLCHIIHPYRTPNGLFHCKGVLY
eukprot:CCRYP_012564-RA/>CCRYP_012564-RA protein AED:0.40 eAED:0.40 QI:0/-1/0/1/-1/0/1/0/101